MEKLTFQNWLILSEEKRNNYISYFFGKCGDLCNIPANIEINKVYGLITWLNIFSLITIKTIDSDKKTVTYEIPNGKNNIEVITAPFEHIIDAKSAAISNCISANVFQTQDSFDFLHNNF